MATGFLGALSFPSFKGSSQLVILPDCNYSIYTSHQASGGPHAEHHFDLARGTSPMEVTHEKRERIEDGRTTRGNSWAGRCSSAMLSTPFVVAIRPLERWTSGDRNKARAIHPLEPFKTNSAWQGDALPLGHGLPKVWQLLKRTYYKWNEDHAPGLGAALSYYTVFSLAPLLMIVIAIAGLVFGQEAAQGQIMGQIQGLVGEESAKAIQSMIEEASKPAAGILATVIATVMLLFGATGVFAQLQESLNIIWKVKEKPGEGIWKMLKDRFLSLMAVLGTGFLLLISLVISAGLSAVGATLEHVLPGPEFVLQIINFLVSFAVVTLLFAMIYKLLPDKPIRWGDVWIGAGITSLLFTIGKFFIGLYLGKSDVGVAYGAAGSLVVILIWVYYASQIFLFGAEFTAVYAESRETQLAPTPHAQEPVGTLAGNTL